MKEIFKKGDKVYTTKGCRMRGNPGELKIVEINKCWMNYEAVICKKLNGNKKLFLVKNLFKMKKGL